MEVNKIIKRPIISERSMKNASDKKYTFEVYKNVSKGAIKKAVEDYFKVQVVSVKTLKGSSKSKRSMDRKRQPFFKGSIKKAIVQIKKDQKIDLFDVK